MASYSPSHTLSQLLVFVLLITAALGAAAWRCSDVWCWTSNKWNLQPPPAQELKFNRTKQPNGSRRPEQDGKGIRQRSPLGARRTRKAKLCWLQSLEPWLICTGATFRGADSDQAGSSKTELTQIPRFLAHYLHFVMQMFTCPSQLS